MRIHRVVGDQGVLARISITLTDRLGAPITSGDVTIRTEALFTKPMTHDGDGVWVYDPQEGDLSAPGRFGLEVQVDGVTLPAERVNKLVVRSQTAAP